MYSCSEAQMTDTQLSIMLKYWLSGLVIHEHCEAYNE